MFLINDFDNQKYAEETICLGQQNISLLPRQQKFFVGQTKFIALKKHIFVRISNIQRAVSYLRSHVVVTNSNRIYEFDKV